MEEEKYYKNSSSSYGKSNAICLSRQKSKKREFRSLWIQRINAGVRAEGLTYAKFINGLAKSKIKLDRKVLAELAYNNPEVFKSVVKKVQSSLIKRVFDLSST